jgi:hypothetical protein
MTVTTRVTTGETALAAQPNTLEPIPRLPILEARSSVQRLGRGPRSLRNLRRLQTPLSRLQARYCRQGRRQFPRSRQLSWPAIEISPTVAWPNDSSFQRSHLRGRDRRSAALLSLPWTTLPFRRRRQLRYRLCSPGWTMRYRL